MINWHMTVLKNGEIYNIPVECERKKRKTLVLRIYPQTAKILFSMPLHTPDDYAKAFFEKNKPWLQKQLEKILPLEKECTYVEGEGFDYFGKKINLHITKSKKNVAYIQENQLILAEKEVLSPAKRRTLVQKVLTEELFLFLHRSLVCIVERHGELLGIKQLPTFKVRSMTSKWGICRPFKKEITFSNRLVHVAPELIDYVVAHELCHFQCLNHSAEFWQLLQRIMPDCKKRRELLNKVHLPRCI